LKEKVVCDGFKNGVPKIYLKNQQTTNSQNVSDFEKKLLEEDNITMSMTKQSTA
jgi:hypothetical protein